AIADANLAVFGLFRVPNMLNFFYYGAPAVALLALLPLRGMWLLKIVGLGSVLTLGYIVAAFAARGPVVIAFALGVLFFVLLLRRHIVLAPLLLGVFALAGFLTIKTVDPLLLSNLLLRFENI